ncbi:MAG: iron-sulfur cluster repair di-iron protein [Flavobacteriaceae bacterium]
MQITENTTIGEIVAHDFRTAALFSKLGIDFCCRGHRTLEEVSEKKSLNAANLQRDLEEILQKTEGSSIDFKAWPLDLLADYVEKTHHRYIEDKTPVLLAFLNKLCKVHGDRHPELFEIDRLFNESAQDLAAHMKKEELILFPFIRKMVSTRISGRPLERPQFGTVENPIEMMKHEHDTEGERFREIARLTDNYTPPADGCNTYRTAFLMLEEFEQDLHKHIHLENNILFPSALNLEKTFN